jgi:RNA polymerase sigma-70 factor (ECF subfamily)
LVRKIMHDAHQLAPLLRRCREGDAAALDGLLGKLRPYVRLLLRSRVAPELGRRLDASDLVQETLLRVCRGFRQFAGDSVPQLLAWVGQIAAHVLASSARHHGAGRRDVAHERPGSRLLERLLSAERTPQERAVRDEEAARLAVALERLPESYRVVIEARFFDQMPFADVARQAGKNVGAVRVLCVRAIARLRQELGTEP